MLLESIVEVEGSMATPNTLSQRYLTPVAVNDAVGSTEDQDIILNNPEDEDRDPIRLLVLENMEIRMVHVLSVEFQPTTSQPSFFDGDVVAK